MLEWAMTSHSMAYHELLAATARPDEAEPVACPVCRLARRALLLWIEDLVYSFGVDPQVRREVRLGRGLCNRHAHLLTEIRGMPLGVSLIHLDVIDTVCEELAKGTAAPQGLVVPGARGLIERLRRGAAVLRAKEAVRAAVAPAQTCLACEHQREVEELYLQTLLRHLSEAELAAAFAASPGLCLPHFQQATDLAPDVPTLRLLIDMERECLARLRDELAEFARKNDHRNLGERVGREADAWIRSIDQVTGLDGVR
jgi:hypothetical protein